MHKREVELLVNRIRLAASEAENALATLTDGIALTAIAHDSALEYASDRNRLNIFDADRLERLIAEDGEALRAVYDLSTYIVTRVRLAASVNIGHGEILVDVEAQLGKIQTVIEPLFPHDMLGG